MLGIFMAIAEVAARFYVVFDARQQELKRKQDAINKGKEFYTDRYGTQHYVKNDQPYFIRSDFDYKAMKPGDKWEVNPYTGEKIRNISAEAKRKTANEELNKAINAGYEYYAFEGRKNHANDKIIGIRYKKISTGEIYVLRLYHNCKLLVNIKTGFAEDWDRVGIQKRREEFAKDGRKCTMLTSEIDPITGIKNYAKVVEITDEVMNGLIEDYNERVKRHINEWNDPWFFQDRQRSSYLILY